MNSKPAEDDNAPKIFPTKCYEPQHTQWPYKPADFARHDEAPDAEFYDQPRIDVQHIDDHAIANLKRYYSQTLPRKGRIVDLCTSWTSHFPSETVEAVEKKDLHVFGVGMNKAEMDANPCLNTGNVEWDLNHDPKFPPQSDTSDTGDEKGTHVYDAATCVVSIDYLTQPREVLEHLHTMTKHGGTVHLVVSDRRFPTKAIAIWDKLSKRERLQTVGDYLHFAGWKEIEFVDLSDNRKSEHNFGEAPDFWRMHDPLWIVRGVKRG